MAMKAAGKKRKASKKKGSGKSAAAKRRAKKAAKRKVGAKEVACHVPAAWAAHRHQALRARQRQAWGPRARRRVLVACQDRTRSLIVRLGQETTTRTIYRRTTKEPAFRRLWSFEPREGTASL